MPLLVLLLMIRIDLQLQGISLTNMHVPNPQNFI